MVYLVPCPWSVHQRTSSNPRRPWPELCHFGSMTENGLLQFMFSVSCNATHSHLNSAVSDAHVKPSSTAPPCGFRTAACGRPPRRPSPLSTLLRLYVKATLAATLPDNIMQYPGRKFSWTAEQGPFYPSNGSDTSVRQAPTTAIRAYNRWRADHFPQVGGFQLDWSSIVPWVACYIATTTHRYPLS